MGPGGVGIEPEELGDGELPVPVEVVLFIYAVELIVGIVGAARGTVVNAVDAPGLVTVTITVIGS